MMHLQILWQLSLHHSIVSVHLVMIPVFLVHLPELLARVTEVDEAFEVLHAGVFAVLQGRVQVTRETLLGGLENATELSDWQGFAAVTVDKLLGLERV